MRWKGGRRSDNIEDRRGDRPSYSAAGAAPVILRFLPALLRTKIGRTILIVGVVVIFGGRLLGVDVMSLFLGGGGSVTQPTREFTAQEQELADFVAVVLGDTEDTWNTLFQRQGGAYREPTLVLFSGRVNSACGTASSAVGPFYCPGDQHIAVTKIKFSRKVKILITNIASPDNGKNTINGKRLIMHTTVKSGKVP